MWVSRVPTDRNGSVNLKSINTFPRQWSETTPAKPRNPSSFGLLLWLAMSWVRPNTISFIPVTKYIRSLLIHTYFRKQNQQHIAGAYAEWAKTLQTPTGEDTVSVHIRIRIPNDLLSATWASWRGKETKTPLFFIRIIPVLWSLFGIHNTDHMWVPEIRPNCTVGAPEWMCVDHIFMKDRHLGVLKESRDWLLPLSECSFFVGFFCVFAVGVLSSCS